MPLPGVVAMPASCITRLAVALSPMAAMTCGLGPMNVNPWSAQISAKRAFSAKKPYPGCTASQPVISAVEIMFGMFKYERGTGPGPTQNASYACRTCSDSRSASEKIATVCTPSSRQARLMRSAISPRLAINTFLNIAVHASAAIDLEEYLAVLYGLTLFAANRRNAACSQRTNRVSDTQCLYVRELAIAVQLFAFLYRRPREVQDADEIRFDAIEFGRNGSLVFLRGRRQPARGRAVRFAKLHCVLVFGFDPEPEQIGLHEGLRQRADAIDEGVVGHERYRFAPFEQNNSRTLAWLERPERGAKRGPQFGKRREHERPLVEPRMGHLQARLVHADPVHEQDVEIDGARTPALAVSAPHFPFGRLELRKQLARGQRRFDLGDRVAEFGLRGDAPRTRAIEARNGFDFARAGQFAQCIPDLGRRIVLVRTDANPSASHAL